MKKQFTPGPWQTGQERQNQYTAHCIGIDSDSAGVSNLAEVFGDDKDDETMRANAALIAAAPDMYETLNALIEKCLRTADTTLMHTELYNAQQAIQKATS